MTISLFQKEMLKNWRWILPDIIAGVFFLLMAFYEYDINGKKNEET